MTLSPALKLFRAGPPQRLAKFCTTASFATHNLGHYKPAGHFVKCAAPQKPADQRHARVSGSERQRCYASLAALSAQQVREDEHYMAQALKQAHLAAEQQEVPVGAVLVCNDQIMAEAYNKTEQTGNPTAHAEMICIQQAAATLGGWRLLESTLYVTLEPCPMCAGALLQSRVGTVVYGAKNTLLGADGSWISLLPQKLSSNDAVTRPCRPHPFHAKMQVRRGVMADECRKLMQLFFQARRQTVSTPRKPL